LEHEAEAHKIKLTEPAEEFEPEEAEAIEISEIKPEQKSPLEYATSLDAVLKETTEQKDLVSEFPSISPEQVEEALERVIKKMYAEKIDHILAEVIEKTVTRESKG
jgi:hypothetical protein